MIIFKRIDAWGQLILIITCTILTLVLQGEMLFWSYFIVGGWQVASTIVHMLFNQYQLEIGDRLFYKWFLFISLITIPVGSLLVLIIIISPFAAIWYCYITFRELRIWEARRLIQLK